MPYKRLDLKKACDVMVSYRQFLLYFLLDFADSSTVG